MSVYIPDELWEAVLAYKPDSKPSHIVQEALTALIPEDVLWQSKRDYALKLLQEANEALGIASDA